MQVLTHIRGYPVVISRFVLDGMDDARTKACQVKRLSHPFTTRVNWPIDTNSTGAPIGPFLLFSAAERLIAENFPHLRPASWPDGCRYMWRR